MCDRGLHPWWRRLVRREGASGRGAKRIAAASWPSAVVIGLLLVVGQIVAPAVTQAAGKKALVVGNSAYAHIGRLPNPAHDAADMEAALERLGFDVTLAADVDLAELNETLRSFARLSSGADVALVFYAGHGMEMDGVNYLLPIDARLERDTDVIYETVPLDRVLQATEGAALRIVHSRWLSQQSAGGGVATDERDAEHQSRCFRRAGRRSARRRDARGLRGG